MDTREEILKKIKEIERILEVNLVTEEYIDQYSTKTLSIVLDIADKILIRELKLED